MDLPILEFIPTWFEVAILLCLDQIILLIVTKVVFRFTITCLVLFIPFRFAFVPMTGLAFLIVKLFLVFLHHPFLLIVIPFLRINLILTHLTAFSALIHGLSQKK